MFIFFNIPQFPTSNRIKVNLTNFVVGYSKSFTKLGYVAQLLLPVLHKYLHSVKIVSHVPNVSANFETAIFVATHMMISNLTYPTRQLTEQAASSGAASEGQGFKSGPLHPLS
jgi:hypothetical protein